MITHFIKRNFSLVGLISVIVGLSAFPASAETPNNTITGSSQPNAIDLQVDPNAQNIPQTNPVVEQPTPAPVIAQISPGTATRSGPSYIGVGGNIGFGGDTTLSEGSFAVFSKIGLSRNFSLRPAALLGDNQVFLIPLTVDFPVESLTDAGVQRISVAPYLGAGAAISTGDDTPQAFYLQVVSMFLCHLNLQPLLA
ncbi:hypothetical protein [Atlanticothrix silvestris]|uniref:hypothetical protein n=1 Tax=Atlanticothrix silvestris TaxID=2840444 RepID=UPI00298F34F4|nr:hypothetical protein [Atlanticothrix silvestris]